MEYSGGNCKLVAPKFRPASVSIHPGARDTTERADEAIASAVASNGAICRAK
uniref:Aldedh domain-containing protein n=1 Tax=Ascaris lumbricoides TaxID=6252 RepID=A0A0M3HFX3_ASCLU